MSVKPDWGAVFVGALFLFFGGIFLWQARLGLFYHIPIYTKGPSWVDPWAALLAGCFFSAIGLYNIGRGFYRRRKPGGNG
jgi:hypothetical protein